jgi:hypothetical protein
MRQAIQLFRVSILSLIHIPGSSQKYIKLTMVFGSARVHKCPRATGQNESNMSTASVENEYYTMGVAMRKLTNL